MKKFTKSVVILQFVGWAYGDKVQDLWGEVEHRVITSLHGTHSVTVSVAGSRHTARKYDEWVSVKNIEKYIYLILSCGANLLWKLNKYTYKYTFMIDWSIDLFNFTSFSIWLVIYDMVIYDISSYCNIIVKQ